MTLPGLHDSGGNPSRVFKHPDGLLSILGRLAPGLAPCREDGKTQDIEVSCVEVKGDELHARGH